MKARFITTGHTPPSPFGIFPWIFSTLPINFFSIRNINLNNGIGQQNSPQVAVVTDWIIRQNPVIVMTEKMVFLLVLKDIITNEKMFNRNTQKGIQYASICRDFIIWRCVCWREGWTSLRGWLLQSRSQHLDLKPLFKLTLTN